ncbi:MAG TPA: hypothetical protein VLG67_02780 [Candidatus Saccharimonadales bacterium]|nr:hypothetical protein [Candidatus Saccharimonadales bacterium]
MRNLLKILIGKKLKGKASSGMIYVLLIMLGIGLMSISLINGPFPSKNPVITNPPVTPVEPTLEQGKTNLQLYTFGYTTPAPTPTPTPNPTPTPTLPPTQSCGPNDDNGIPVPANCKCDAYPDTIAINCKNGIAYHDDGSPLGPQYDSYCGGSNAPNDGRYCIAKPVIYLYPTVPTIVSVKVESAGKIVVSDPLYPSGGWKNILAFPTGDLYYQSKRYTELFYESEVTEYKKPKVGIIIKSSELSNKLDTIIDQLGLIDKEKQEFIEFWVPRLQAQKSPYIFFSILEKQEKERLDKVIISPQPDTKIEFIAYFKPINSISNYDGNLKLPAKPERKGFVSVEWGGSLDTTEN